MKKEFAEPLCEVVRFEVEDVLSGSGWNTEEFGIRSVNDAE